MGLGVGVEGVTEGSDVPVAALDTGEPELVLDCVDTEEGPDVADSVDTDSVELETDPDGVTVVTDDFVALVGDSVLAVADVDADPVDSVLVLVDTVDSELPGVESVEIVLDAVDTEVLPVDDVEVWVETVVELVVVDGQDCAEMVQKYVINRL